MPLVTAYARRHNLTRPRQFVLVWVGLYVVMNIIAISLATHNINNHFLTPILTPLQGIAILWALSLWQTRQVARLAVRLAIPFFLVAWIFFAVTIENADNFSVAAEPVYSLLALAAAAYTLVARSADASEPVTEQDWFWICSGLALHFVALAVVLPLSAGLTHSNPALVIRAYSVRGVINVVAFLLIAYGFLCPTQPTPSGSSS